MDIKLFQQKLNEICTIAEENGKQLSQQQIREHFDESDLSTSQLVKILQYLKLKGITIEGADEAASAARADAVSSESSDKEELPRKQPALRRQQIPPLNPEARKNFQAAVQPLQLRNRLTSVTIWKVFPRKDLIPMILRPSFRPLQRETLLPKVH